MAIKTPAYLKWRDGRPRWEPGPRLRQRGFRGQDLKSEAGAWLGIEAAIAEASRLNAEVAAWKDQGSPRRRPPRETRPARTCIALAERYYASADFQRLAPSTQADYRRKLSIFLATEFGSAPVGALSRPQLIGYWQQIYDTRGHAMANGIKATISLLLTYAEMIGWRQEESNPALNMRRPKLPPRVAIWTPDKCEAFVATADDMGLHGIADALVIALHTSQRLSDILAMPMRILTGDRVALTQMKRKALIDAPLTPQLANRISAIKIHRAASSVVAFDALAVTDIAGRKYDRFAYNKGFRLVRAATISRHPDLAREQRFAPGLAELTFQDTRDTAVTRLALAGCTLPQIAAITGHSPGHITGVIKHYLALDVAMADQAIAHLTTWLSTNRIAI